MQISGRLAATEQDMVSARRQADKLGLRDFKQWLEGKASDVSRAAKSGNTAPLWALVRTLSGKRRRGPKPAQVLEDKQGAAISTKADDVAVWRARLQEDFDSCEVVTRASLK